MKYRVDQGDPDAGVAVGICACGRRFLAFDRVGCLERLAAHEKVHHPAAKDARVGLAQARRARNTPKK